MPFEQKLNSKLYTFPDNTFFDSPCRRRSFPVVLVVGFSVCIFVTWCLINKDKLLARLQTVILITYHYSYECCPTTTRSSYVSLLREQLCQKMRILSPKIFLYMGLAQFFCCCKNPIWWHIIYWPIFYLPCQQAKDVKVKMIFT